MRPGLSPFYLVRGLMIGVVGLLWMARRKPKPGHDASAPAPSGELDPLAAPDFAALERATSAPTPAPLRALYGDAELLSQRGLRISVPNPVAGEPDCWVEGFEPLTGEPSLWSPDGSQIAIARAAAGGLYLVDPRDADPAVLYVSPESGRPAALGAFLSDWVTAAQRAARA